MPGLVVDTGTMLLHSAAVVRMEVGSIRSASQGGRSLRQIVFLREMGMAAEIVETQAS
jgi:hypothetical protein